MAFNDKISENEEKEIRFASGIISYFGANEKTSGSDKISLTFDGVFDDNDEKIKRTIKISKYVKGYNEDHSQLYKDQYPIETNVYEGSIQLETWEWEGHNCLRVIAFEIDKDLGPNPDYKDLKDRGECPFIDRK